MSEDELSRDETEPEVTTGKESLLLRKLPYLVVLALTLFGVAYTGMSNSPLVGYWEFVALVTGGLCISTGWTMIRDNRGRIRLLWSQVVHWAAILVAMNIVLLPGVQRLLTGPATGLAVLLLLALGTFLAGIHVSVQICLLGVVMALLVPAIAWLKGSAFFIVLVLAAAVGLGLTFWWRQGNERVAET